VCLPSITSKASGVVELINGKMRTPKIETLHRLIDLLNHHNPERPLPFLTLDVTSLYSNAWLGTPGSDPGYPLLRRAALGRPAKGWGGARFA